MLLRDLMGRGAMVAVLALLSILTFAQAAQPDNSLVVRGYQGQAPVVTVEGRPFVDVEALAQITSGSVGFNNGRIELTLPASAAGAESQPAPAFSRSFMTAAIETIASLREWGSTLVVAIQNGYPIGNAMNGYRGRAMDRLRIASASASTDADRRGLELLQNEFNNVQAWSNKLVNAQKAMSAGDLSTSDDALKNYPMYQGIVQCGQFLGPMLAGGTFQDDSSCH
jgi:hypothetical protein